MRREYRGGARKGRLSAALGGSSADLTIVCESLPNWPTGDGNRPFFVVLARNTPLEEKILCSSRSGNVITVFNSGTVNGRGADDTSIASHQIGTEIEHIYTATDANEANAHVNANENVHGVTGPLVGTTATQTLTNKTLQGPTITNATISNSTFSGGITSTQVVLTGNQTLNSFRARNVYAALTDPTGGNDGDIWIKYNA